MIEFDAQRLGFHMTLDPNDQCTRNDIVLIYEGANSRYTDGEVLVCVCCQGRGGKPNSGGSEAHERIAETVGKILWYLRQYTPQAVQTSGAF